jgi:glucan biosynthesis protein C
MTRPCLMLILNPWRLFLLFFISGLALRFSIDKFAFNKLIHFAWKRTWFLFLPILFGIYIVVAPQVWLELLENKEIDLSFLQFYPEYIVGSTHKYSIQIPTWNHLWYVVYLMLYSLLLVPFSRPLSSFMNGFGGRFTKKICSSNLSVLWILLLGILPHLLFRFTLDPIYPVTHDVINDWANHAHSFTYFLLGYLLAKDTFFWNRISQIAKPVLLLFIILIVVLSLAWQNWDWVSKSEELLFFMQFLRILYIWVAILSLLILAQKFLNKPSKLLTYMTESIFSWYILHQTLIIVLGYWLTRQHLSVGIEFVALTVCTFIGCFTLHELVIRRFKYIRPLFGTKINKVKSY